MDKKTYNMRIISFVRYEKNCKRKSKNGTYRKFDN